MKKRGMTKIEQELESKGDKLMKKLFVSIPMRGRTDHAIRHSIEEMHKIAEIAFGEKLEVIDSHFEGIDVAVKNWSIYYLGKSIKAMANADYFIGIDPCNEDTDLYRGCNIERNVARYYNIPSLLINVKDYVFFKDIFANIKAVCPTCDIETKNLKGVTK